MDPILSTLVGALIAAVAAMWAVLKGWVNKLSKRSDECEDDRKAIKLEVANHKVAIALFKTCSGNPCPARDAMEKLETFNLKRKP